MKQTYAEIKAQIARLQTEAAALKTEEVNGVIARIKEAIATYGLTAQDLGLRAAGATAQRATAGASSSDQPKYADGQGQVWGGRGPRPAWLREALANGHALEDFAVNGPVGATGSRATAATAMTAASIGLAPTSKAQKAATSRRGATASTTKAAAKPSTKAAAQKKASTAPKRRAAKVGTTDPSKAPSAASDAGAAEPGQAATEIAQA